MRKLIFLLVPMGVLFSSCNLINQVSNGALTNDEIVDGLKTALKVGTDTTVATTSKVDAFYTDVAIKILLPSEADVINQYKDQVPGLSDLIEPAIHSMNRAAEDAAPKARDIFISSITNLSISDALSILNGSNPASGKKSSSVFDSTAATNYLKSTTYATLKISFQPQIDASLSKPLLLGVSTNDAWNNLTGTYNTFANNSFGLMSPVNVNLSDYVTQKALDGLFYKVGEEERKIRRDPLKWATTAVGDILKKVFGS